MTAGRLHRRAGGLEIATKTVLAVRHVAFEDLGGFEAPLKDIGYAIHYADMGMDRVADLPACDLLAVLGGPVGAYEDDLYPYLKDEIALIASRLTAARPVLGICLGAQLMALGIEQEAIIPAGRRKLAGRLSL